MIKQLYLIEYENAHWCGGGLSVCAWAESEDAAVLLAESHMEEEQRELFSDEYAEDEEYTNESPYVVNSVSIMNEQNECWQYYQDEQQRATFYPTIGEPD